MVQLADQPADQLAGQCSDQLNDRLNDRLAANSRITCPSAHGSRRHPVRKSCPYPIPFPAAFTRRLLACGGRRQGRKAVRRRREGGGQHDEFRDAAPKFKGAITQDWPSPDSKNPPVTVTRKAGCVAVPL
ncbi:hypothetical protein ACFVJH_08380 [Streptomyces decoyicus]|uniref:hypothetical protein n=1 Tax=Streptomyces decoyicus TaxID=249567 RepID=UPI00362C08E8